MSSVGITYSLADHDFDHTKSIGIFNVAVQLLENMAGRVTFDEFVVLGNSSLNGNLRLPQNVKMQCHDQAIKSMAGRILWDQLGAYDKAGKGSGRWLFLPKGYASFLRPRSFKLAVYIHDTIHEVYRSDYPGFVPWFEMKYFTECLKNSIKYSEVIFTNSDFTKDELKRLASTYNLRLPPVITAGIGFERKARQGHSKRGSLLLLTSMWPHKLTKKAINFVDRWQKETDFRGEINLVGGLPDGVEAPHRPGWAHYPRLAEEAYSRILSEAGAMVFFSAYEGFGMPPVEAIAAGTCPVFSDLPATREVMGKAGFSFSNDSYESFSRSMDGAFKISEAQIDEWADKLLEDHSWEKVVDKVCGVLNNVK